MDTAVGVVKAYLELCGYLVLAELPVREAEGGGYRDVTDLNIVAVRFPHPPVGLSRHVTSPLEVFLGVDPALQVCAEGADVIVGEVKEGHARLTRLCGGLRRWHSPCGGSVVARSPPDPGGPSDRQIWTAGDGHARTRPLPGAARRVRRLRGVGRAWRSNPPPGALLAIHRGETSMPARCLLGAISRIRSLDSSCSAIKSHAGWTSRFDDRGSTPASAPLVRSRLKQRRLHFLIAVRPPHGCLRGSLAIG